MVRAANKCIFFLIIFFLFLGNVVFAFPPPRPGLVDDESGTYRTTGLPQVIIGGHVLKPAKKIKPAGLNGKAPEDVAVGAVLQGIDAGLSSVTPVVFLVDFSDRPQHRTASDFPPLFFGTTPADKSVANYWTEVSYGAFTVSGLSSDIFGWFRSGIDFPSTITLNSQLTDTSTGLNSTNFLTLLNDLISSLDPTVDFSRYDADADGVVDSAILVHAGYGGEDTGDTINDIWSQTLFFSGSPIITGDGVNIEDVVIVPEEKFYNDGDGIDNGNEDLVGIGVIVHEMGHLMGLPDLYPTTTQGGVTGSFSGVGVFDLMGFGLWGNTTLTDQDTPSHLSAWSKTDLNWADPVVLSASGLITLSPVEIQPDVVKVFINGSAADPTQYILIENRQQSGSWIFDNALPGDGILIWHIDESVIDGDPGGIGTTNRERNVVNINSDFKGIDLEEADGEDELDQPFAGPISFGESADFFNSSSQIFDRDNPKPGQNETNSSPIISESQDQAANNGSLHPTDNLFDISLANFTVAPSLDIQFDFTIISPPSAPDWKTFDQVSTDPSSGFINGPIVSDDVNVVGQDSSNAVWFGTADRGISRLSGRVFESFNTTSDNLPSNTITAFAFDENTGVMWVGTDNGFARMRDSGSGFVLIPDTPFLSGVVINDLAIDGEGFLWAATDSGLSLIDDGGTDSVGDDIIVPSVIAGVFDAVVVSPGGNLNPLFDVVWAYDNAGRTLYRSSDESNVLQFTNRSLPLNPIVNDLAVDATGLLWIATQNNGVLVYDDKLTIPFSDDELDPLDVDQNGITNETFYITTSQNIASNRVTGVTFQEIQGQTEPIAYFSHRNDGVNDGGVTRTDLNFDPADRFIDGLGLSVFREQDLPDGPASNLVRDAFTDRSGNIWFSTEKGASRFGNAGILTLDSTTYLNLSAIATVTVDDDGLNIDTGSIDTADVRVTSDSDPVGFDLTLQETGDDTGFFSGTFGFTEGSSEENPGGLSKIAIQNGNTVTVTYSDASPPGVVTATAVWRKVVDFDDGIWIEGCFIASAAFGSYSSQMVKVFREFRDDYLLGSYLGRKFVSVYYRVSPRGARFIRENGPARILTRSILVPLALFIHAGFKLDVMDKAFLFLCVFAIISIFWFLKWRVCRKRFD